MPSFHALGRTRFASVTWRILSVVCGRRTLKMTEVDEYSSLLQTTAYGAVGIVGGAHQSDRQVWSSMWYQMIIYFNICFSVVYFIVSLSLLVHRLNTFYYASSLVVFLNLFMFFIWTIGETFRLSVAYLGNIQEQVPLLAASLLGTFIATMPSLLYLTFSPENKLPFDTIGGIVLMGFGLIEAGFNIYALHRTIDFQTAKFFRLTREIPSDEHMD